MLDIITKLLGLLVKSFRDKKESQKIYNFLLESKMQGKYNFRSTEPISSNTNIPESRIEELCSKHKNIKRNELEKMSWRIVD